MRIKEDPVLTDGKDGPNTKTEMRRSYINLSLHSNTHRNGWTRGVNQLSVYGLSSIRLLFVVNWGGPESLNQFL